MYQKRKERQAKKTGNNENSFSKVSISCLITIYLTPKKYDRLDENLSFL
ncbi:MAG: hypothetical protein Q4E75_00120 [bacterium]|nr:hypothetical protein [bacterium]